MASSKSRVTSMQSMVAAGKGNFGKDLFGVQLEVRSLTYAFVDGVPYGLRGWF